MTGRLELEKAVYERLAMSEAVTAPQTRATWKDALTDFMWIALAAAIPILAVVGAIRWGLL
jgi:hypothetical protein